MKKINALSLVISFLLFNSNTLFAQWIGIPDKDNYLNAQQISSGSTTFKAQCSDGSGGAIYAWSPQDAEFNLDVKVNRIDSAGKIRWGISGIFIGNTSGYQVLSTMIEDGHGGCYIAYIDATLGGNMIVQHIDSNGTALWGNGIQAFSYANQLGQSNASMVNNNGNGMFIAVEAVYIGGADGIRAQKFNYNGVKQWGSGGSNVNIPFYNRIPKCYSDNNGGIFILWYDGRIRAQRLNSAGTRQFDTANYVLNTYPAFYNIADMISSSDGNFIAVWTGDNGTTGQNIYSRKISLNGAFVWTGTEKTVCDTTFNQNTPVLISDNNGGALYAWRDSRNSGSYFVQLLNSNGVSQWQSQGKPVYNLGTAPGYENINIFSDGNGGAKLLYNTIFNGYRIWMQQVNGNGTFNYTTNGISITANGTYLGNFRSVVPTGIGDALVFVENGAAPHQLFAKKVTNSCNTAKPLILSAIASCPPKVTVKWEANVLNSYEVRYKLSSATSWTLLGNIGRVDSFVFAPLSANMAYTFSVRGVCINSNVKSAWNKRNKTTMPCTLNASVAEKSIIESNIPYTSLVFPNPSNGIFTVSYKQDLPFAASLKIRNINGKMVYDATMQKNIQSFKQCIDISSQPEGMYIVEITVDGKKNYEKLMIFK